MAGIGQGMSVGASGGGHATGFLAFIPASLGSLVGGFIYPLNPAYPWLIHTGFLGAALVFTVLAVRQPSRPEQ